MKRIVLSMAALASVAIAGGSVAPVEKTVELLSEVPKAASYTSILDRINFKGDLRLRYESIERDDDANKYRNRYRLRLGSKITSFNEGFVSRKRITHFLRSMKNLPLKR